MKWPTQAKETQPLSPYHAELFWKKVDILGPDDCWTWRGYVNNMGYGQYCVFGDKPKGSHRLAYALTNGPVPAGANVCHRCDTPLCVNPNHLFLGTQKDNIHDMGEKGRQATGERNGNSKMTADRIRTLREDYSKGVTDFNALGKRHGCSDVWAAKVVRRKVWNGVA